MGIYDRDYVFNRQRRGLSVNAWIIIINVLVFITTATPIFSSLGLPSLERFEYFPDTKPVGAQHEEHDYLNAKLEIVSPRATHDVGRSLQRLIVDEKGTITGAALYTVDPPLYSLGYFSTHMGFRKLEVWRLVTFQFLHAGFTHILFNMFGLYIFGRMVEEHLGGKRYLAFYLMTGICGGLTYLLLNGLGHIFNSMGWPKIPGLLFDSTTTHLIGASAGVFGVIMAAAYIAPNSVVQLLFPPIPLKLRTFAYTYVAIAAISLLLGAKNKGGEAAHVGGALAGYFFIRNSYLLRDFFDVFADSRRKQFKDAAKQGTAAGKSSIFRTSQAEQDAKLQAEVDRILAKVSSEGLQSLSDSEKELLRKATELGRQR